MYTNKCIYIHTTAYSSIKNSTRNIKYRLDNRTTIDYQIIILKEKDYESWINIKGHISKMLYYCLNLHNSKYIQSNKMLSSKQYT